MDKVLLGPDKRRVGPLGDRLALFAQPVFQLHVAPSGPAEESVWDRLPLCVPSETLRVAAQREPYSLVRVLRVAPPAGWSLGFHLTRRLARFNAEGGGLLPDALELCQSLLDGATREMQLGGEEPRQLLFRAFVAEDGQGQGDSSTGVEDAAASLADMEPLCFSLPRWGVPSTSAASAAASAQAQALFLTGEGGNPLLDTRTFVRRFPHLLGRRVDLGMLRGNAVEFPGHLHDERTLGDELHPASDRDVHLREGQPPSAVSLAGAAKWTYLTRQGIAASQELEGGGDEAVAAWLVAARYHLDVAGDVRGLMN